MGLASVAGQTVTPASQATRQDKPARRTLWVGGLPAYRIYPLLNGMCTIAGNHAFHGGDNAQTYDYALYIWLILGGEKPILATKWQCRGDEPRGSPCAARADNPGQARRASCVMRLA